MTVGQPPLLLTGRHDRERIDAPSGVIVRDAHLVDCDFSGQRLPRYVAFGSLVERCDFRDARLVANLSGAPRTTYRDCDFSRADLRQASPALARFERCVFAHARLDKWFATQAEFVDCRFAGPIKGVRFAGSISPEATAAKVGRRSLEFLGNDFSQAELTDVGFVGGIDIGAQRWPSTPDYLVVTDLPAGFDAAETAVATWPDGEDRRRAKEMLGWMRSVFAGQRGQVRRRGQSDGYLERVWELIATGSAAASGSSSDPPGKR